MDNCFIRFEYLGAYSPVIDAGKIEGYIVIAKGHDSKINGLVETSYSYGVEIVMNSGRIWTIWCNDKAHAASQMDFIHSEINKARD